MTSIALPDLMKRIKLPKWEVDLEHLPIIAASKLSLIGLDWGTFALVAFLCVRSDTTDAPAILNFWFLYLGGLHGFNYAGFRTAVNSPTTTPSGAQMNAPAEATPNPPPPPVAGPPAVTVATMTVSAPKGKKK